MKVNILRALALSLASTSMLAPAWAQYPQHGPSVLTTSRERAVYFQDDLGVPPDLRQVPVAPEVPPDAAAQKGAIAPFYQKGGLGPVIQKDPGYAASGDYGSLGGAIPGYCDNGCGPWFGYVGGLLMTRDDDDTIWLSYDQGDPTSQILTTSDADDEWGGGFETRLGRYFNGGCNGIELVYWGLFPGVAEGNAYDTDTINGLDTNLDFDGLEYDPGTGNVSVASMFEGAERHRIRRSWEVHNVEVNLLGNTCGVNCNSPLQLSWLAGIRYLRFDDGFEYATDTVDTEFNYTPDEMFYDIDVENHLIGFQLGGRADFEATRRARLWAATNVGIYGNHLTQRSELYGANPASGHAVVTDPSSPYILSEICVDGSKNDVAFLGELRLGLDYCITSCWSFTTGYRILGISGVGLATNQIPVDGLDSIPSVAAVDSNGSVILHGFFAGTTYNW